MPKIIIKRVSEWNNRFRNIGVYVNGEKLGVIKNGEIAEYEIEPCRHELSAKIDWCGSQSLTLELKAGQSVGVELSSFKFGKWIMPLGLILSIIYFSFGDQIGIHPGYYLAAMALPLAFMVYLLTFGRNRYLRLKKIN
tara:strand:+ start:965 stop:1378 length:414 start_codon:yes stop_codon:yes gene_type:complete